MTKNNFFHPDNYLPLALVVAGIIALLVQLPLLLEPSAIEEDFRNLYWVHRFEDPELFPNVSMEKLGVRDVKIGPLHLVIEEASPGYTLLLQVASIFMPPALFIKLLIFPLLLSSVYFIFQIGATITTRRTAFFLSLAFVVMNLSTHTEISVTGGLHRSFVTPFLLGLLYFLINEQYRRAAFVVFLSGIIYLPIFPVCAMTCFYAAIRLREGGQWRVQIRWRMIVYLAIASMLVILVVSPTLFAMLGKAASTGAAAAAETRVSVFQDPRFQEDARAALFQAFPFVGRGGIVSGNSFAPLYMLFLFLFAVFTVLIRRRQVQRLPAPCLSMFLASATAFILAWIGLLVTSSYIFYIPNRHTQSSFLLLLFLFVAVNFEAILQQSLRWIMAQRQRLVWYLLPVMVIVVGLAFFLPEQSTESSPLVLRNTTTRLLMVVLTLLLFMLTLLVARRQRTQAAAPVQNQVKMPPYLLPGLIGFLIVLSPLFILAVRPFFGNFYYPSEAEKALFAYIETLPRDSRMGGEPCLLDSVPFYAKRGVLFHCERLESMADAETIEAMLGAYYSESGAEIDRFCRDYDVDYLVVDEEKFAPDFVAEGDFFYSPYNEWLVDRIQQQQSFVLDHVPEEKRLFQAGQYYVIPCDADALGADRNELEGS